MKKDVKTRVWGALEAVSFVGIYFAAGYIARFLMYVVFAVYYAVSNYNNHEIFHADTFVNQINNAISSSRIEITILADILMVIFSAIVICARGEKFKKYMAIERKGVLQTVGGLATGCAIWYIFIYALSALLAGSQALVDYGEHVQQYSVAHPYLAFALTAIVAPVTEEFIFRGALFKSMEKALNKPMAIIVTSLLFALVHINPVQMSYAFVLGIMLAFIRSETGMLTPCIAMHFAFNIMNYCPTNYMLPPWAAILLCCGGYALALYKKV